MKRNRNSFFTNYNASSQSFIPDGMPTPNQQMPYTQTSMNSNYYSGPTLTNSNDMLKFYKDKIEEYKLEITDYKAEIAEYKTEIKELKNQKKEK